MYYKQNEDNLVSTEILIEALVQLGGYASRDEVIKKARSYPPCGFISSPTIPKCVRDIYNKAEDELRANYMNIAPSNNYIYDRKGIRELLNEESNLRRKYQAYCFFVGRDFPTLESIIAKAVELYPDVSNEDIALDNFYWDEATKHKWQPVRTREDFHKKDARDPNFMIKGQYDLILVPPKPIEKLVNHLTEQFVEFESEYRLDQDPETGEDAPVLVITSNTGMERQEFRKQIREESQTILPDILEVYPNFSTIYEMNR